MPRRKRFNPFKMFGSYIGAFIFLLIHFIIDHQADFISLFSFGSHLIRGGIFALVGFVLGWGIHSLFRKFS